MPINREEANNHGHDRELSIDRLWFKPWQCQIKYLKLSKWGKPKNIFNQITLNINKIIKTVWLDAFSPQFLKYKILFPKVKPRKRTNLMLEYAQDVRRLLITLYLVFYWNRIFCSRDDWGWLSERQQIDISKSTHIIIVIGHIDEGKKLGENDMLPCFVYRI